MPNVPFSLGIITAAIIGNENKTPFPSKMKDKGGVCYCLWLPKKLRDTWVVSGYP